MGRICRDFKKASVLCFKVLQKLTEIVSVNVEDNHFTQYIVHV